MLEIERRNPTHDLTEKPLPRGFSVSVGDQFKDWVVASDKFKFSKYRIPCGKVRWVYFAQCRCICGGMQWVNLDNLKRGLSGGCGCVAAGKLASASVTHGKSKTPIYGVWCSMVQRTTLPSCRAFKDYGGRGIGIDPRWLSFEEFYKDMGDPPFPKASLERLDNDEGYSKGNVVWATRAQQARNKRNTRLFEFQGEARTLSEWAERTGIGRATLASRVYVYKWPIAKALTLQVRSQTVETV